MIATFKCALLHFTPHNFASKYFLVPLTYVSGRIGYNVMEEAPERAINLIEAGHYYTEFPITAYFADLVGRIDSSVYIEIADSNMIKIF